MVSLTGNALRVAEAVRERLPEALLVAGGPLPTVFPGRFLPHVDVVFRGEADVSFPRVLPRLPGRGAYSGELGRSLSSGTPACGGRRRAREDVAPCTTRRRRSRRSRCLTAPTSTTPPTSASGRRPARPTTLLATLGCPYSCEFCSKPVFGNDVRLRPLDAVVAEIDDCCASATTRSGSPTTRSRSAAYLEEFCRRIEPLGITWSCLSRADGVDVATARVMYGAGCRRVYLGLESGSQARWTSCGNR